MKFFKSLFDKTLIGKFCNTIKYGYDYINDYVTPEPKELMSIGSFSSTKRKRIISLEITDILPSNEFSCF